MANPIILYSVCGKCHGDGQFPNAYIDFHGDVVEPESTVDCPSCDGMGRIAVRFIDTSIFEDTLDKVSDVLDKCSDILEKLNE